MGEHSINEKFVMSFRPIESFFGIEVGMVKRVVLVAYLWPREGISHEL